ncbi:hypothetical protein F4780DRAFT_778672 [Xylariomycetidae sp. FL0641]|nr:hypothetical protein F4780DRAFT_778672 [Xylariomycetidae sp. FL0641]
MEKLVVGHGFFAETKTTTTAAFGGRIRRVVKEPLDSSPSLLGHLQKPAEAGVRIHGRINGHSVYPVPDTAAQIMAISAHFAKVSSLKIDRTKRTWVRFLDGSCTKTRGTTRATWDFDVSRSDFDETAASLGGGLEWHVVDGLPVDAILSLGHVFIDPVYWFRALVTGAPKIRELLGISVLKGGYRPRSLLVGYGTDITSSDPFSQDMAVREYERRPAAKSILDTMEANGVAGVQEKNRLEQERTELWDQCQDLSSRQQDWQHLRQALLDHSKHLEELAAYERAMHGEKRRESKSRWRGLLKRGE